MNELHEVFNDCTYTNVDNDNVKIDYNTDFLRLNTDGTTDVSVNNMPDFQLDSIEFTKEQMTRDVTSVYLFSTNNS